MSLYDNFAKLSEHPQYLLLAFALTLAFTLFAVYCFWVTRYSQQWSYEKENALFINHPNSNQAWKGRNPADYLALLLLGLYVIFMFWNNFYLAGPKRNEDPLFIDVYSRNLHLVPPWISWGRRFAPFMHQDLNILGLLSYWLKNPYYFYYLATFLEFLVTVYFLNKIIPLVWLWQRALVILFIVLNASFLIPFSNFVIPDRNTTFFTVLFLYAIIEFYKTNKNQYLIFALALAHIAIYFKEPTFLFFGGFALTALIFRMIDSNTTIVDALRRPFDFVKKNPLEIGVLLAPLFFVVMYATFQLFIVESSWVYGLIFSEASRISVVYGLFITYPLFPLILIMVACYVKDINKLQRHRFSIMLFAGGVLYIMALIYFRFGSRYYYCLPELVLILAACFYLKGKSSTTALRIFVPAFILFYLFFSIPTTISDFQRYKINEYKFYSHKTNIKLKENQVNKVFSYGQGGELGPLPMQFVLLQRIATKETPFVLHLFADCALKSAGRVPEQFRCLQVDEFILSDYDLVIFWRSAIPDDEWKKLYEQYGEQMQKITDFPKYLQASEQDNIYIIERTR